MKPNRPNWVFKSSRLTQQMGIILNTVDSRLLPQLTLISVCVLGATTLEAAVMECSSSGLPTAECDALKTLYNQTGGDSWSDSSGWRTQTQVCNPGWEGVSCGDFQSGLSVVALDRAHNTLTGTLPDLSDLCSATSDFAYMSATCDFDLSSNHLSGTLITDHFPDSLSSLDLSHNQLEGVIPPSLAAFNNLTELDLSYNQFTAQDADLIGFLNDISPNWADTQTIAPDLIDASALSTTAIELLWTPIPYRGDEGYYEARCGTNAGGPYSFSVKTDDKTVANAVFNNLSPLTTYYCVVETFTAAHDEQKNDLTSRPSREISVRTLSPTQPLPSTVKLAVRVGGKGEGSVFVEELNQITDNTGNLAGSCDNSQNECDFTYKVGQAVQLKPSPAANAEFVGWGGSLNCASEGNVKLLLNSNNVCVAYFKHKTLPLTVTFEGEGSGRVTTIPEGIDCNQACQEEFIMGTPIQLVATPEPGSVFKGWSGDCPNSLGTAPITLNEATECQAIFGIAGTAFITAWPQHYNFVNVSVNEAWQQNFSINNLGQGKLQIDAVNLSGDNTFKLLNDNCSARELNPWGNCNLTIEFQPQSSEPQTATLMIASNDADRPSLAVPLQGSGCTPGSVYRRGFSVSIRDNQLNFGTELIDNSISRSYWVNSWTLGCGTLQPDFPELTGNHAAEFTISKQDCYQGSYRQPQGMYSYASCQTTITFTPTTVGEKQAQLALMFNDDTVTTDPVSIQAQAVEPPGEVKIKLTPEALDFGNLILGRDATVPKAVTIENQGEVNLNLNQMRLTGEAASAFSLNSWYWHDSCAQKGFLFPQESCQTNVQFSPLAEGEQRAQLVVLPDSAAVALIGRVRTPVDCGSENITLKTSGQSFNWHEATSWSPERLPTAEDVVLIQPDHAITGIPFAQVKSLCIATGGSLVSADHQGTPLEIQATDYIENRGIIRGLAGANEESGAECTQAVGTTLCAQGGASVILKVGTHITRYGKGEDWWWQSYTSGGPILNLGQIIAGDGGHGQHYGASGGHAIVLGRNTVNKGQILAGHGGDILGLDNGAAGHGGITQIWGKLGGSGHLYNQDGAQAFAGDGGNCNPNASGNQRGGEGGNLWLVSIPNVHLGGGQHRSGKGGNKCAINGEEGDVIIEPSLISLAGANTRIEGNQVTIFGGLDWQLDLTDLQTTVVEAKGDITLAVGEGGIIDFRGSRGTLFKAAGQVNLFADEIALDSDTVLSELIEAEQIVVGPAQILWDIALTGPGTVLGAPGDTVPLYLTLANNSPELVGVQFQATDSAGWPLAELSEKIQVPALTSVNLALNVTLPTTLESTDQVTVTASLDQAPSVTSTTTVQIIVSENAPRHENNRPIIPAEEQNQPNDTPVEPNEGQDNTDAPPISEETPPPTTPIGMAAQINAHLDNCPLSGTIDFLCTNYGRRISDAVLTAQASIAGGELSGVIENAGMIAQVILQPDTVLSGGKGSGYIINHGTLKDFEFVGAEVQGGTLAGMIFNNSRVGGVLKDVHLAAATQVRGGQLQGEIIGDAEAPALLTQLTVKSGSQLNHVMIGDQVTLADEVTLGDNVQFLNPSDSPLTDTPDDELPAEPSTPEPSLPALGAVNAQNAQGQTLTVEAEFSGGIQVSGNEAQQTAEVELTDNVEIIGMMDSEHAGQTVDLIVYAAYTPLATPEAQPLYYMLTEQEQILPWDQEPANLVAFKPAVTLQAKQLETFYDGHFLAPGHLDIYYGYRTEEGHIITHLEAIKVTIVE